MHAKRVLVAAVVFSLFLSLVIVTPLSAQGDEPVVVISGKDTAFNKNMEGDPPLKDYESSPPVMIAVRVGSGAVVAAGTAGACRDGNWNDPDNPYPYLDKLLDAAFEWMVPGATKVLWYEGYSVYTVASSCLNLLDNLRGKGYSIGTDDRAFENIENLTVYNILVIPQMQLGATGTGGDPSLLPAADVQAIVDFVEGGGGLLIMEQADYNGYNFSKVHNKILEALGLNIRFQDDQVQDDANKWGGQIHQPIVDVDTTTDIGSAYESETGENEIGLGDLCSLRIVENYDVNVRVEPPVNTGLAGETLTYEGEIVNIGTENDNYTITVEDELGWSPSVSLSEISLENGASAQVEVRVTVPEGLTEKVADWITLKAVGVLGAEDNARFRAVNVFPLEGPHYQIAHPERTFFWFSICTQLVELPAVPIMTGIETGYSVDLTSREPWPMLYGKGEYPPVAAAALVGDGRLITAGPACLRSSPVDYYTDMGLAHREFAPLWPKWLIDWGDPREHKFLYYVSSVDVFHDNSAVATWLADLRALGFEIGILEDHEGGELLITPELLENYDVLQIAELERSFSSDEKQAIVNWVNGGGGLLLMVEADYAGYGAPKYSNELLEALGVPITFQDDELYDQDSWTAAGWHFPQVYLLDPTEVNPEFDVWFPEYTFTIQLSWSVSRAESERVVFPLTITNTGTVDSTYEIEVEETTTIPLSWDVELKPAEVGVASGENTGVYIVITIPDIEIGINRMDLGVEVTCKEATYITASDDFAAIGENGWTLPPLAEFEVGEKLSHELWGEVTIEDVVYGGEETYSYIVRDAGGELRLAAEGELGPPGISWPIIAAVIVVIVAIAIVGYWAKKTRAKQKRTSSGR